MQRSRRRLDRNLSGRNALPTKCPTPYIGLFGRDNFNTKGEPPQYKSGAPNKRRSCAMGEAAPHPNSKIHPSTSHAKNQVANMKTRHHMNHKSPFQNQTQLHQANKARRLPPCKGNSNAVLGMHRGYGPQTLPNAPIRSKKRSNLLRTTTSQS